MKFLTNIYNPKNKNAKMYLTLNHDDYLISIDRECAWQIYSKLLNDKVIADPQATYYYTVQQLLDMNIVGVYMD